MTKELAQKNRVRLVTKDKNYKVVYSIEVRTKKTKGKHSNRIDTFSSQKSTKCESVVGDYDVDFPCFVPDKHDIDEGFSCILYGGKYRKLI